MKIKLLTLLIVLCALFTTSANAQVYIPLINDTTAQWYCTNFIFTNTSPSDCIRKVDYKLFFNGDTTIGSNKYYKLFASGTYEFVDNSTPNSMPCSAPSLYYFQNSLVGYITEINKKIYYKYVTNNNEIGLDSDTILYNFNLQVGDTVPNNFNNSIGVIDSISINGVYHKQYSNFQHDFHYLSSIIEGVGSSNGLLSPAPLPFNGHNTYILNCYVVDSTHIYTVPWRNCNYTVGRSNKENNYLTSTTPNPFTKYTLFKVNSYMDHVTLTIINSQGTIVKVIKDNNGYELKLERDNLTTGLYFYQLHTNTSQLITGKLLIED